MGRSASPQSTNRPDSLLRLRAVGQLPQPGGRLPLRPEMHLAHHAQQLGDERPALDAGHPVAQRIDGRARGGRVDLAERGLRRYQSVSFRRVEWFQLSLASSVFCSPVGLIPTASATFRSDVRSIARRAASRRA